MHKYVQMGMEAKCQCLVSSSVTLYLIFWDEFVTEPEAH